ncbi:PepSY domain-containing protein [Oryzibacter oryziterrae]|uniref:PepSY domain-containing protein n=1 Tax=Oryzibacter oryziterrae TaxID=2766474 RepID=UPI001F28A928|nr:PepSY domain-containing protein [Oryzibacter oryziterrae]
MKYSLLAVAFATLMVPSVAFAEDEPTCTDKPQAEWLTKDAVKAKAEAAGYHDIKQVKIEGSCYEIYGFDKDGKKAEVVFNPITGEEGDNEAAN